MQPLAEQKATLRRQYLDARCAMEPEAWSRASNHIHQHLLTHECYRQSETIITYVSSKDNEVDTWAIIDAALAAGKQALAPVMAAGKTQLRWARIQSRNDLAKGRFGLLEPEPALTRFVDVPPDALCLVPGIIFTKTGQRIGYGGGYYDRFLETFPGISIGLSFELQLAPSLPSEAHDQSVRYVLTETGWYPDDPAS